MANNYVYGKNSVLTLLEAQADRVFKVFVAEGLKPDKRIDRVYDLAHTHGIAIQRVPRQKLNGLLQDEEANHQGVLASVAPRPRLDIVDLAQRCEAAIQQGESPLVLVLDGVTDPGNFGAILRVADAAGASAVVVPKFNSVGFGPAVSKTSSGADQTVDVVMVPNLVQAMSRLQKAGCWSVGTSVSDKAVPYYEQSYTMPTVLVMGSEGKGLSRLVQEACDFLVKIPMQGAVDSLNVATATAVLAFEIRRQQAIALQPKPST
jgi:23S rRNA (guanosine2251-2'-O)-methyltransferase